MKTRDVQSGGEAGKGTVGEFGADAPDADGEVVVKARDPGSFVADRAALGARSVLARAGSALLASWAVLATAAGASAQSTWIAWGGGQVQPPPPGQTYVDMDRHLHTVALVSDGTIVAWGENDWGQCDVPPAPPGTYYVEVSAGSSFTVARRSDGQVVVWGYCDAGACDVPPLPPGVTYVEIDAGNSIIIARRSDGIVVGWGYCLVGGCDVPPPPPGLAYVDISAAGGYFGRLSDGTVVRWGDVDTYVPPLPPGLTYVEIAASCAGHTVARRSDGSVIAWGLNEDGQCNVPPLPPGTAYVEVEAGCTHTVLRRSDGVVLAFGDPSFGQLNVPALPPGFVYGKIETGGTVTFARVDPLPACGSVASFCWPPSSNSVGGSGANFEVSGCPGLAANDLVFGVDGLPPAKFGLFYYGTQQKHLPYGNGWTCVGGSSRRVRPGFVSDANGRVTFAVDLTQFPFTGSAQAIQPGSAWNFQYWYRDTAGSPSTFNFSNGRHIVFAP